MSEFELVEPKVDLDAVEIDWKLCVICQKVQKEEVVNPVKKRGIYFLFWHTS